MNWKIFKEAFTVYLPNEIKKSWRWWREAHPVLWIIQVVYLIILGCTFYYPIKYGVAVIENSPTIPAKESLDWFIIMLFPFWILGVIGLWIWIGKAISGWIIKKFKIPVNNES